MTDNKWETSRLLKGRNSLSFLSPQETIWFQAFHWMTVEIIADKLPVKVFVWMQDYAKYWFLVCRIVPNTGARFAASVLKYQSSACRLCAPLPVLAFWLYADVCWCMYADVSCRCVATVWCVARFINWRLYELWCTSTVVRSGPEVPNGSFGGFRCWGYWDGTGL